MVDGTGREMGGPRRREACDSRILAGVLALVSVLAAGQIGRAGDAAPPARSRDGFAEFCEIWMTKLAERERMNLEKLTFHESEGALVGEYTGYERVALKCASRVSEPGKPGVGLLMYHQLLYRKRGPDSVSALASEPQIVERVEVTEVFRYDGKRWRY